GWYCGGRPARRQIDPDNFSLRAGSRKATQLPPRMVLQYLTGGINIAHGERRTPVRCSMERKRDSTSTEANRLLRISDLNKMLDALVAMLKTNASGLETLVVVSDVASGQLRFDMLRSSLPLPNSVVAWLEELFTGHPALVQKLLRSELV